MTHAIASDENISIRANESCKGEMVCFKKKKYVAKKTLRYRFWKLVGKVTGDAWRKADSRMVLLEMRENQCQALLYPGVASITTRCLRPARAYSIGMLCDTHRDLERKFHGIYHVSDRLREREWEGINVYTVELALRLSYRRWFDPETFSNKKPLDWGHDRWEANLRHNATSWNPVKPVVPNFMDSLYDEEAWYSVSPLLDPETGARREYDRWCVQFGLDMDAAHLSRYITEERVRFDEMYANHIIDTLAGSVKEVEYLDLMSSV